MATQNDLDDAVSYIETDLLSLYTDGEFIQAIRDNDPETRGALIRVYSSARRQRHRAGGLSLSLPDDVKTVASQIVAGTDDVNDPSWLCARALVRVAEARSIP